MKKLNFKPEKRKKSAISKVVLALPAILSIGWIILLEKSRQAAMVGLGEVMLSPPADSGMLIIALTIFTVGYLVFLLLMFSEDIRDFILNHQKH